MDMAVLLIGLSQLIFFLLNRRWISTESFIPISYLPWGWNCRKIPLFYHSKCLVRLIHSKLLFSPTWYNKWNYRSWLCTRVYQRAISNLALLSQHNLRIMMCRTLLHSLLWVQTVGKHYIIKGLCVCGDSLGTTTFLPD